MTESELIDILVKFKTNRIDINSAIAAFEKEEKEIFARIDHMRVSRCGFPEFVYGANKTAEQLKSIIEEILSHEQSVLITKLPEAEYQKLRSNFPEANYDTLAKTFAIKSQKDEESGLRGNVVIVTAGTSDIPVALEAKYTADLCGCKVNTLFDVGVAGIHRLLSNIDQIRNADAVIVVAGMEGALPSVVAGLVPCPVIAVPTSVGYGASLGGLTAMFAMLNSCANGVMVANIDNGFGAGCAAARIINKVLPVTL